jgi:hypothetical protein
LCKASPRPFGLIRSPFSESHFISFAVVSVVIVFQRGCRRANYKELQSALARPLCDYQQLDAFGHVQCVLYQRPELLQHSTVFFCEPYRDMSKLFVS